MAMSSGRSLFVFGPAGNGKSTLSRALHQALGGELWIPHCIAVENQIIRLFDPSCHQPVILPNGSTSCIDRRWIRIRRPLITVGGELTLDALDLSYSPALKYYEAPLHVKANGGTLVIDDFGRQRIAPHELLNRWIIPLEQQIDYLTLHTGQQAQFPFRQMLMVATNLKPEEVTDPAFLRRMGYRLHLDLPSWDRYVEVFERYVAFKNVEIPTGLLDRLRKWYQAEGRALRCCEPRDLIERIHDFCRLHGRDFELNEELLKIAWEGYFGNAPASAKVELGPSMSTILN